MGKSSETVVGYGMQLTGTISVMPLDPGGLVEIK